MNKKSILILLFLFPVYLFSQETATNFFTKISNKYSKIEAYTADFKFVSGVRGDIVQEGVISYMAPDLLRLDYSNPEEQVLCVNRRELVVYVPEHQTLFRQTLNSEAEAQELKTSGLTSQGLILFLNNYSISYLNGPDLEALDQENKEEVYKLRLYPRKSTELYKRIILSITSDGFIRRLEGLTRGGENIRFDIVNVDTTVKLNESDFEYDAPGTSTILNNFLYTPGDDE